MPPISLSAEISDLDKLLSAFDMIKSITSINSLLEAFGLDNLPAAHKYGLFFGCLTFILTVSTVLFLLVFGGSFTRIKQQSEGGTSSIPSSLEVRKDRPLLYESLLEARKRMIASYESDSMVNDERTVLMKLLNNVAPDITGATELRAALIEEEEESNDKKKTSTKTNEIGKKKEELKKFLPEGYEANYVAAYRKCQDKPGGKTLSGVPEARYEAYARAFAGSGIHTHTAYRRSYARLYEAISCRTHEAERKSYKHWLKRSSDIVGRTIRLEGLERSRHLKQLYNITSGRAQGEFKQYDPNEIWCFHNDGPFENEKAMERSGLFRKGKRTAGYGIVEALTDRLLGAILLEEDDPSNLTVSIVPPFVRPSVDGTVEQVESCFLLMDRLFALGYRRIQMSIDSMDVNGRKLAGRIGFTQEGTLLKHHIIKDSNRDSTVYGMINSDWNEGAREFLFKKTHGDKMMKADKANNVKEEELEVREKYAAEQKEKANENN